MKGGPSSPLQQVQPRVTVDELIDQKASLEVGESRDHPRGIDVVLVTRILALEKQLEIWSQIWNARRSFTHR